MSVVPDLASELLHLPDKPAGVGGVALPIIRDGQDNPTRRVGKDAPQPHLARFLPSPPLDLATPTVLLVQRFVLSPDALLSLFFVPGNSGVQRRVKPGRWP